MSHFPGHTRDAFREWVEGGCGDVATVEVKYVPTQVAADELLRRMTQCSDILPNTSGHEVLEHIGYGDCLVPWNMTYGQAASVLLVERTSGDHAAQQFLGALLGVNQ